jgi:hypothetical protein
LLDPSYLDLRLRETEIWEKREENMGEVDRTKALYARKK